MEVKLNLRENTQNSETTKNLRQKILTVAGRKADTSSDFSAEAKQGKKKMTCKKLKNYSKNTVFSKTLSNMKENKGLPRQAKACQHYTTPTRYVERILTI